MITICALYHFASIAEPGQYKAPLLSFMEEHDIKGTLMLAKEGINGTVSGSEMSINALLVYLKTIPGLEELSEGQRSHFHSHPFGKAKVKVRGWVLPFPEPFDPNAKRGEYVAPEAWNALISDPQTLCLDTRNKYEVEMGRFKGAKDPKTRHFKDIISYTETELSEQKNRPIAIYCTGGIRCEKYSAYLKEQGFERVYHLKGGILSYLNTIPETDSLWEGTCFVFDEREAVGHGMVAKSGQ